jgi:cephalosporin-C deacetylase
MPIVDMPLEKLKEYKGINPKPSDFEEYWDNNIALADKLDTNAQMIPYEFKNPIADCYDLYFTGTGNAKVHAKLLIPKKNNGKCPALLNFHGYHGRSSDFVDYLGYVAAGFVVAALDCRGQGGLSQELGEGVTGDCMIGLLHMGIDAGKENLLFKHVFLDTYLLSKIVKNLPCVDKTRIGAYGGSQGGALTVACSALDPDIKMLSPDYPFLSDYKRVWEMDLAKGAYEGLRYYFRHFDPRHEREDEIFEKLGYIDIQFLAPRIRAKVLMGTGLMDTTCPPSTQFAMFNKITSEKKVVIYPDFGHESLKGHPDIVFDFLAEL